MTANEPRPDSGRDPNKERSQQGGGQGQDPKDPGQRKPGENNPRYDDRPDKVREPDDDKSSAQEKRRSESSPNFGDQETNDPRRADIEADRKRGGGRVTNE